MAFERLEPCAVKIACTVLRGLGGGNAILATRCFATVLWCMHPNLFKLRENLYLSRRNLGSLILRVVGHKNRVYSGIKIITK
jgi:hypothetical protein